MLGLMGVKLMQCTVFIFVTLKLKMMEKTSVCYIGEEFC